MVWLTVPIPVLILFILVIRGVTLPGAGVGLTMMWTPDFGRLTDPDIWQTAVSQIFFSISAAMGIMPSYASYNPKTQDVVQDAVVICLANSFFSLTAGMAVFSILGYMADYQETCVATVAEGGPGLAFVVFPTALSVMPGSWVFAILFFLMLLALGIDSAFSMGEALNTAVSDCVSARAVAAAAAGNGDARLTSGVASDGLKTIVEEKMKLFTPIICVVGEWSKTPIQAPAPVAS